MNPFNPYALGSAVLILVVTAAVSYSYGRAAGVDAGRTAAARQYAADIDALRVERNDLKSANEILTDALTRARGALAMVNEQQRLNEATRTLAGAKFSAAGADAIRSRAELEAYMRDLNARCAAGDCGDLK